MGSTVVANVNVNTMQLVPGRMAPVTVPRQGGLGCSVISPAQGGTMVSTALKNASVRMGQLVISLQVNVW